MKDYVIGKKNGIIGFVWLLLFSSLGSGLEIWLGATNGWGTETALRSALRSAHSHALCLAFLCILYGIFIDKVNLSDNTKKIGSLSVLLGMIFMPTGLILGEFLPPLLYLSPAGGFLTLFGLLLIVVGFVRE